MSLQTFRYQFSYSLKPYLDSHDQALKNTSSQNAQGSTPSTSIQNNPIINPGQGFLTSELFKAQKIPLKYPLNSIVPTNALDFWTKHTEGFTLINNLIKTMYSPTRRFAIFSNKNYFIFYHIKGERTIVKFGAFINSGSKKNAWKVIKIGPIPKTYCLLLPKISQMQPKLITEFLVTKLFKHPNIVECRKLVKTGFLWNTCTCATIKKSLPLGYQTTFYEAGTAARLLKNLPENKTNILERVQIICDIAKALLYIHSFQKGTELLRLAHTDVKLSNIFLTIRQNRLTGVLGDTNPQREGMKSFYVTPIYLPPELGRNLLLTSKGIIKGEFPVASQASDIWALGLCLYQMIYGRTSPLNEPSTKDPDSYQLNYEKFFSNIYKKMSEQPIDSIFRKVNLLVIIMLNPCTSLRITTKTLVDITNQFLIRNK